jgi:uncharacterized delta-60 repeat protein
MSLSSWIRCVVSSVAIMRSHRPMSARRTGLRPFVEVLEDRLAPTAGMLDPTFGTRGVITTAFGPADNIGNSMAIDSNGKIVVAGYSYNGNTIDFALARYNQDGSLDNSFNHDGKVTTAIGSHVDEANSVAIDGNGKIVVAGYSSNGSRNSFALARYNQDGSLDNSFNHDGMVTTSIGIEDIAQSVVIDSDGKIVVAGTSYIDTSLDFAVVRYNTDGSLDTSFNHDGKVTTPFGSSNDWAQSVAIDSNGKIVVAGYSGNGSNYDFAVARYNTDGSLDTSFDHDGKLTTSFGSFDDFAYSVAIDGNGKIIVAGNSFNGTTTNFALARYNADGSLDTSFDMDGKVTTSFHSDDVANALALDGTGKIVAAGYSYTGRNFDFALARYNADGSLDKSFDGDGKTTTPFGSSDDFARAIAIDGNCNIVAAGYSANGNGSAFALARYEGDSIFTQSIVSIVPNRILPGRTAIVTLFARDANGHPLSTGGLTVAFGLGLGVGGVFGPVTDHGNGIYTATFKAGLIAGSNRVTATINRQAVTSIPPSFTIATPRVSGIALVGFNALAGILTYQVEFNTPVTGVDASCFGLRTIGPVSGTIRGVTGSGDTYTVSVLVGLQSRFGGFFGLGIGFIGLSVMDDNRIRDLAGNPLGGLALGDGAFNGPLNVVYWVGWKWFVW